MDEIKRKVVGQRGGVGAKPVIVWHDTRHGFPEYLDVNTTAYHDTTVYIPELPSYRVMGEADDTAEAAEDVAISIRHVHLTTRMYATTVDIVERTEVDVSDPLHPVINIYGYKRVYRALVWMSDDEARAIDRLTDARDSAESEA